MTSGQKIAFSLLAALALFAVFVMSLNSTLFKTLETRFYAQAKIEENTGQLDKISESCDSYISDILSLIEKGENAWTKNASVRSYYVQNPSESDVNTRRKLTETLFSDIPALSGIRIVDKNGRNVHYSSFDDTDLLKQNGISKIYKNYSDIIKDADEISFEQLQKISNETKSVLLCDEDRARLIISVPFCWVDGIYSGMALFYLNLNEVENEFFRRDILSLNQKVTLYSDDDYNGGLVFGIPQGTKKDFRSPFISYWKERSEVLRGGEGIQQPQKLLAKPDGSYYVGLSSNRIGKIRVSAVYSSELFELSPEIRILIYICIFISILLVVFLFFSFFRDPMVTLQKRIKKIQLEIIENYIDGKEKREWSDVTRHLRQRRNDLSDDIIKSLHVHSKKRRKELSDYLDKNWDEIFAIFEAKTSESSGAASVAGAGDAGAAKVSGAAELTGASIAEIRRMLEEVLQNRSLVVPAAGAVVAAGAAAVKAEKTASPAKAASPVKAPVPVDEVEELDDVDEIEEVEDLDDAEVLDEVEEIEEAEELAEEAGEVEEVEELAEDVDEVEEAEDVEEVEELAEEAEDVEEVEELTEEADEVEEVEELAEEADDIEEVEELAEEAEPVDDIDEVEELEEEAEEIDEVEELAEETETVDEVEELSEEADEVEELAEDADAAENVDEVEEIAEDAAEADEIEDLAEESENEVSSEPPAEEPVEELDDAEEIDEVEELDDAEEVVEDLDEEIETLDDEVEVLDEYVPPQPDAGRIQLEAYLKTLVAPVRKYKECDETFFASEKFPTVDNLYAEELKLGDFRAYFIAKASPVNMTLYPVPPYNLEAGIPQKNLIAEAEVGPAPAAETVEELAEEVPDYLPEPDFSMISFADNLSQDVPELEGTLEIPKGPADAIVEKDGVFSISETLKYTDVVQDKDFKNLVDSILK